MSGLTRFLITDTGLDLSYVFMPLSKGTAYPTPSGYLLSNGNDLTTIFAANLNTIFTTSNTSSNIPYNTGLLTSNGTDLTNIFNSISGTDYVTPTISGGPGTYTKSVVGTTYTITFTSGTNTISFDKSILYMNVIIVGGGGGGRSTSDAVSGGGGGGGGFCLWTFDYASGNSYNISVAEAVTKNTAGNSSTFKNSSNVGVTSTGGGHGLTSASTSNVAATAGTCTTSSGVTATIRTGGTGGLCVTNLAGGNGGVSSGPIIVIGQKYNYGGGGGAGDGNGTKYGGTAGSSGVGGTGGAYSAGGGDGEHATTPGSGGGGGGKTANSNGGNGGPGLVMIIFTYPPPIPLSIEGCSLWMDANDTSSMSLSSNLVNIWYDKSPNGYFFTSGINKPTLVANSQNSKSTVSFVTGSSNYLQGDARANSFAIGTNSYALFAVFKVSSGSNGGIYNKSGLSGTAGRIILTKSGSPAGTTLSLLYTHTGNLFITAPSNSLTTYQLASMTINRKTANKDTSYANGTESGSYSYSSADTTNYGAITTNYMFIGANNTSSSPTTPQTFLDGHIGEIISYTNPDDMTDANRQKIEGYLAWKWGINNDLPANHPYYSAPP